MPEAKEPKKFTKKEIAEFAAALARLAATAADLHRDPQFARCHHTASLTTRLTAASDAGERVAAFAKEHLEADAPAAGAAKPAATN